MIFNYARIAGGGRRALSIGASGVAKPAQRSAPVDGDCAAPQKKVRRAQSAYELFKRDELVAIKSRGGSAYVGDPELHKSIKRAWGSLDPARQALYASQAERDKDRAKHERKLAARGLLPAHSPADDAGPRPGGEHAPASDAIVPFSADSHVVATCDMMFPGIACTPTDDTALDSLTVLDAPTLTADSTAEFPVDPSVLDAYIGHQGKFTVHELDATWSKRVNDVVQDTRLPKKVDYGNQCRGYCANSATDGLLVMQLHIRTALCALTSGHVNDDIIFRIDVYASSPDKITKSVFVLLTFASCQHATTAPRQSFLMLRAVAGSPQTFAACRLPFIQPHASVKDTLFGKFLNGGCAAYDIVREDDLIVDLLGPSNMESPVRVAFTTQSHTDTVSAVPGSFVRL
ncbi:MAG: hypothetical protein K0U66_05885 [Gammaproteobacteria bacterium]|nr:hypothetical protein [Gammaproteobacteria bacterium]